MTRDLEHRSAFESMGETAARVLAQQAGPIGAEATAWLAEQQAIRDEASSTKRDTREKRTLEIAEDALSNSKDANLIAASALANSRSANKIAIAAAILAAAATIIAAIIGVSYAAK